ncbi:MAG TPA: TolC family protein [Bryobacteraceae bacterium]|jgi:outer membrane protein TolC
MSLKSKLSSILLLMLSFVGISSAQAPLTVEQATERAATQSRDVLQAKVGVQAKAEDASVARTRRWPSLSTSAQVGPLLNRASVTFDQGVLGTFASTGPIPARNTDVTIPRRIAGYDLTQVSLPLSQQPRLGLAVASANRETDIARQQEESVRLNQVSQTRNLYFQIVALEEARRAANAQVDAATETLRLAREAVEKGTGLPLERAESEARLAQAKADAAGLETDIRNGREQLNLLIGEPLDTQFVLTSTTPRANLMTLEEARKRALEAKPEVKEARLRLDQSGLSLRSKRLEYIPDVNLQFTYLSFLNSSNALPNQIALAGFSLTWEPWDWGRKRHEAAGLRDKQEQARLTVAQTEQQVQWEAGRAWRELDRAQRNLDAARLASKSAEENLRVVRERHAKQSALERELLVAQTNWESAGQQQARAAAAVGVAWANFQAAIGAEQ